MTPAWWLLCVLASAGARIQLPEIDSSTGDEGFAGGARTRYVADPDAEAAASLTKLVPLFLAAWCLAAYAAYRAFRSESWLSVAAVAAAALVVARS